MVRMPGFGLEGPWRERPGFAASMEQVSGLAWITGYTDGPPSIPGICDPLAGMHAAFAVLTALEHRARTGEGQLIELAMIDLAANLIVEQVLEHSVYGHLMGRQRNHQPGRHQACTPAATRRVDRRGGGLRPGVVGTAGSARLAGLVSGPRVRHRVGAFRPRRPFDEELGPWLAGHGQMESWPPCVGRGGLRGGRPLLRRRPRPSDERPGLLGGGRPPRGGSEALSRLADALRLEDRPLVPATGAAARPHNHEVLGALGITQEELAALAAAGVIGTRPAGLRTTWSTRHHRLGPHHHPGRPPAARPRPPGRRRTRTRLPRPGPAPRPGGSPGMAMDHHHRSVDQGQVRTSTSTPWPRRREGPPVRPARRPDAGRGVAPGHPPRPGSRAGPGLHSGTADARAHPGPGRRPLRIDYPAVWSLQLALRVGDWPG